MAQVVKYYRSAVESGKTILNIYPVPQFIQGRSGWVDLDLEYSDIKGYTGGRLEVPPVLKKKLQEYEDLIKHFRLHRVAEKVILETDQINSVNILDRTPVIRAAESKCIDKKTVIRHEFKHDEDGEFILGEDGHPLFDEWEEIVDVPLIPYERELVWVDGAENIPGVIVLPHDDYDRVYVLEGSKDAPEIRFIDQHGLRPNYELAKFQRWFQRRFGYIPTKQDIIDFNVSLKEAKDPTSHEPFGQDILDLFDADEAHREALEKSLLEEPPPRPYFTQPGDGKTYIYVSGFSGGAGSQADPYIIETVDELQDINQNLVAHYVLGNDIDASDTRSWNDGAGFVPIGDYGPENFNGKLRGEGHQIVGLYCEGTGSYAGLFGYTWYGCEITDLALIDCVLGPNLYVGLIGEAHDTTIKNCFVSGILTSHNYCGGIVGYGTYCIIGDSYSSASVDGNTVGGLAGHLEGANLYNCYSVGVVTGGENAIGGLVGSKYQVTCNSCFWDMQTSGQSVSASGIGKTTAEMMSQSTFTNWDFTNTWWIKEGETYPGLWNAGGYPITNVTELQAMKNKLDGIYYLANDIDASDTVNWNSGEGFEPIGLYVAPGSNSTRFAGRLDGKGHSISNLYINRSLHCIGLVGIAGNGLILKNIRMVNPDIKGRYATGAILGSVENMSGLVENCGVEGGTIYSSETEVAGFVGALYFCPDFVVRNCYTTASLNSFNSGGGGFCGEGQSDVAIQNCYSACELGVKVQYGFSRNLSSVTGCYWDTTIGGTRTSGAGTAKTTAQMKTQSTYTGWDFTNIWGMDSAINDGYPHLLALDYGTEEPPSNDKEGSVSVSAKGDIICLAAKNALGQIGILSYNEITLLGEVPFEVKQGTFILSAISQVVLQGQKQIDKSLEIMGVDLTDVAGQKWAVGSFGLVGVSIVDGLGTKEAYCSFNIVSQAGIIVEVVVTVFEYKEGTVQIGAVGLVNVISQKQARAPPVGLGLNAEIIIQGQAAESTTGWVRIESVSSTYTFGRKHGVGQVAISGISTIDLKSGKALSCTFNISCKADLAISGIKQGQAEVTETTIPELKISGGKYALSTVGVISYGRIIIKVKISKAGLILFRPKYFGQIKEIQTVYGRVRSARLPLVGHAKETKQLSGYPRAIKQVAGRVASIKVVLGKIKSVKQIEGVFKRGEVDG